MGPRGPCLRSHCQSRTHWNSHPGPRLPDLSSFCALLPPLTLPGHEEESNRLGDENCLGSSSTPPCVCRMMQWGHSLDLILPQAPLLITEILHLIFLTLYSRYEIASRCPKQSISSSGRGRGIIATTFYVLLHEGHCAACHSSFQNLTAALQGGHCYPILQRSRGLER